MYLELREPIFRYLLRLSGNYDLAEELTQETFLQALQALPKFRKESSIKTWLYAIARNTYLHRINKDRKKDKILVSITDDFQESGANLEDPAEQFLQKEQNLLMKKAIYSLQEAYRTVIILKEFEELSYKEIAGILGKTENWVRVTFFRAKQSLKEIYETVGKGEGNED